MTRKVPATRKNRMVFTSEGRLAGDGWILSQCNGSTQFYLKHFDCSHGWKSGGAVTFCENLPTPSLGARVTWTRHSGASRLLRALRRRDTDEAPRRRGPPKPLRT